MNRSRHRATVTTIQAGASRRMHDFLAGEEPMETRVKSAGRTRSVAVTMRTPGADFELAAGFLFAEGLVARHADIKRIAYCSDDDVTPEERYNVVTVSLRHDPEVSERRFLVNSACGVCGKGTLEQLRAQGCHVVTPGPVVAPELLFQLPGRLRGGQAVFESTGGLHAAALFDADGVTLALREDVGRHNALDKLVGWALLQDRLPLSGCIVMVSGRASFELLQKCALAGAPIFCAVSAPSSLAVATAEAFGITLVGFLREGRCNVYTHPERVRPGIPSA